MGALGAASGRRGPARRSRERAARRHHCPRSAPDGARASVRGPADGRDAAGECVDGGTGASVVRQAGWIARRTGRARLDAPPPESPHLSPSPRHARPHRRWRARRDALRPDRVGLPRASADREGCLPPAARRIGAFRAGRSAQPPERVGRTVSHRDGPDRRLLRAGLGDVLPARRGVSQRRHGSRERGDLCRRTEGAERNAHPGCRARAARDRPRQSGGHVAQPRHHARRGHGEAVHGSRGRAAGPPDLGGVLPLRCRRQLCRTLGLRRRSGRTAGDLLVCTASTSATTAACR